jgi:hypothetical protein
LNKIIVIIRVLRKTFRPKRDEEDEARKTAWWELHNLYSSPNIG